MAEITDHVDIDATPDEVWAVLADVRQLPDYSSSTVAMEDAPAKLTKQGQTFTQVVKVVGKRWKSKWKVLEIDPGRFLCTEGSVGPGVTFTLTQTIEERDDHARLQLRIRYKVPGGSLGDLVSRAGLERRAKRESTSILHGIRDVAEAAAKAA